MSVYIEDIRNEIKSYIVRRGLSMRQLADIMSEKYNKSFTVNGLSQKLRNGTLRYSEAKEIAEALGFDIKWVER